MKKLEEIENLFPVIPVKIQQSIKGGGGYDDETYWGGWLDTVVIDGSGDSYTDPYSYDDWYHDFGGYNGNDYGMGSGYEGGGGGGYSPENHGMDIAANAIATGLAFNEYYATMDAVRLGETAMDTNSILKNIFDTTPVESLLTDLKGASNFNGIAILNTAGKVLGVTQAATSAVTLFNDLTDGDGQVSMVNIADTAISVGSLFIKSNVVGAAVSLGWLLIKGNFETPEEHAKTQTFNYDL